MLWFTLSLITALVSATEAAFLKHRFSDITFWEMASFSFFYGWPVSLGIIAYAGVPDIHPDFWYYYALLIPLNVLGFGLHMRSIHLSPLSMTMPFQAFTPAFVILTGWFILGETLEPIGIAGTLAIVLGGYILAKGEGDAWGLEPFRRVLRERGPAYMLGAATVYAFCAVLGKKLILLSSPLFLAGMFALGLSTGFFICGVFIGKIRLRVLLARPVDGCAAALFFMAHIIVHNLAIALAPAAYMMAIKRLNGIFSVLLGWAVFHETEMRFRLPGAILMAVGAAIIILWG